MKKTKNVDADNALRVINEKSNFDTVETYKSIRKLKTVLLYIFS